MSDRKRIDLTMRWSSYNHSSRPRLNPLAPSKQVVWWHHESVREDARQLFFFACAVVTVLESSECEVSNSLPRSWKWVCAQFFFVLQLNMVQLPVRSGAFSGRFSRERERSLSVVLSAKKTTTFSEYPLDKNPVKCQRKPLRLSVNRHSAVSQVISRLASACVLGKPWCCVTGHGGVGQDHFLCAVWPHQLHSGFPSVAGISSHMPDVQCENLNSASSWRYLCRS